MRIRKRFEEKVVKLVDVGLPYLCRHLKDSVLGHVMRYVRKRGGGSKGDH